MEERPSESREAPANAPGEGAKHPGERFAEASAGSGWTTTKQAAKVLGVSRRSVQTYVRRGLLEAQEEGKGANKRFFVSIDSLNTMLERRRGAASETAKFAEASAGSEEAANLVANDREGLRHVVDRLEARTAEATELRIRLELTERAESTLRADLEEARRRREQAERERDELAAELATLQEARDARQTEAGEAEGQEGPFAEEPRPERSWWRRWFGFE